MFPSTSYHSVMSYFVFDYVMLTTYPSENESISNFTFPLLCPHSTLRSCMGGRGYFVAFPPRFGDSFWPFPPHSFIKISSQPIMPTCCMSICMINLHVHVFSPTHLPHACFISLCIPGSVEGRSRLDSGYDQSVSIFMTRA